MKRRGLKLAAVVWTLASAPQIWGIAAWPAFAQDAAPTPVADTAPPSGQVEAPPTTTVSKPSADSAPGTGSSSAVEGTLDAVAPGTPAPAPNKLKAASIKDSARAHTDKGDSSESGSDSSPFAGFENNSNHGPINIKSDTMSFDYKKSVVIFSGRVHAVQAGNELSSNTLHVQMNKSNQIQEMIADGNVRMSQGQRWATGDHAVLDESLHTLVLTGSPVVHDGNDQIAGTKITVYLQTNKSEVTDPKAVIFPRESKNPNNSVAPTTGAATAATGE